MMKISLEQLMEMNACQPGIDRFIAQTRGKTVEVLSLIGGKNTASDLAWLAGRTLPKERVIRFIFDCALINIEKIRPYTDQYDEIVSFLKNSNTITVNIARAIIAARDTADTVATVATPRAARIVARTGWYAASCASAAAYLDAAWAARTAPAAGATEEQINNLLKELFS